MDHSFFYELAHRLYLANYPEQFFEIPFMIQTGDESHYVITPYADTFDEDHLFIGCSFCQLREKLDLSTAQNVFSPYSIYEYVMKLEYLDHYDLETMVKQGNTEAASTLAYYKKKKYQDPELPYAFLVYEMDGLDDDAKHYPLDQEHYMALLDCLNVLQKLKAMGKKKLIELLEDDSYEGTPILAMDGDQVTKIPYPSSSNGLGRSLDLFRGVFPFVERFLPNTSEAYDDEDEYDDEYDDDEYDDDEYDDDEYDDDEYDDDDLVLNLPPEAQEAFIGFLGFLSEKLEELQTSDEDSYDGEDEDGDVYDLEDEDEDEDEDDDADADSPDTLYEELPDFLHSSNKIVDFHSRKKQ